MKTIILILMGVLLGCEIGIFVSQYAVRLKSHPLTDKELLEIYQANNHDYFHDALPKKIPIHWANLDNAMGEETHYEVVNKFDIQLDPRYLIAPVSAEETLLHEECHVYIDLTEPTDRRDNEVHGPTFQACMMNLARQGAMDGIW